MNSTRTDIIPKIPIFTRILNRPQVGPFWTGFDDLHHHWQMNLGEQIVLCVIHKGLMADVRGRFDLIIDTAPFMCTMSILTCPHW